MTFKTQSLQGIRNGIIRIDLLERNIPAYGDRLAFFIPLEEIKIHTSRDRCHYGIMSPKCSLYTTFNTSPGHHSGTLGKSTFENFIPSDNPAAVFFHDFFDSADKITLKPHFRRDPIDGIRQSLFFYYLLTQRAFFPFALGTLISADMNIL